MGGEVEPVSLECGSESSVKLWKHGTELILRRVCKCFRNLGFSGPCAVLVQDLPEPLRLAVFRIHSRIFPHVGLIQRPSDLVYVVSSLYSIFGYRRVKGKDLVSVVAEIHVEAPLHVACVDQDAFKSEFEAVVDYGTDVYRIVACRISRRKRHVLAVEQVYGLA